MPLSGYLLGAVFAIGLLALGVQLFWAVLVYPVGALVVCGIAALLAVFGWWLRPLEDLLTADDLTESD